MLAPLPLLGTLTEPDVPLQHGRGLTLHHFQQLWGHLQEWQVRGLGGATSWKETSLIGHRCSVG